VLFLITGRGKIATFFRKKNTTLFSRFFLFFAKYFPRSAHFPSQRQTVRRQHTHMITGNKRMHTGLSIDVAALWTLPAQQQQRRSHSANSPRSFANLQQQQQQQLLFHGLFGNHQQDEDALFGIGSSNKRFKAAHHGLENVGSMYGEGCDRIPDFLDEMEEERENTRLREELDRDLFHPPGDAPRFEAFGPHVPILPAPSPMRNNQMRQQQQQQDSQWVCDEIGISSSECMDEAFGAGAEGDLRYTYKQEVGKLHEQIERIRDILETDDLESPISASPDREHWKHALHHLQKQIGAVLSDASAKHASAPSPPASPRQIGAGNVAAASGSPSAAARVPKLAVRQHQVPVAQARLDVARPASPRRTVANMTLDGFSRDLVELIAVCGTELVPNVMSDVLWANLGRIGTITLPGGTRTLVFKARKAESFLFCKFRNEPNGQHQQQAPEPGWRVGTVMQDQRLIYIGTAPYDCPEQFLAVMDRMKVLWSVKNVAASGRYARKIAVLREHRDDRNLEIFGAATEMAREMCAYFGCSGVAYTPMTTTDDPGREVAVFMPSDSCCAASNTISQ
jgi:hypothetical protein